MQNESVRQLAAAVTLQAVKDYFSKRATQKSRAEILKDLRSKWMQDLTSGTSLVVAEQLEKNHREIYARVKGVNFGHVETTHS